MNKKSIIKWIPVVIAAAVAAFQTIGEQKEQERIDAMDARIAKLENKEEA